MWISTIFVLFIYTVGKSSAETSWAWTCDDNSGFCTRGSRSELENQKHLNQNSVYSSVELCRLVCGKFRSLWPQPSKVKYLGKQLIFLRPSNINIYQDCTGNVKDFMQKIISIFKENLLLDAHNCQEFSHNKVNLFVHPELDDLKLDWTTDESYKLEINTTGSSVNISISGKTVFGVRHGLETLSQLITSYPLKSDKSRTICLAMLSNAQIWDNPAFPHRGLLLDTSRNFLPIWTMKKHIKGMATSKLNYLHWHLTDTHSFPFESPQVPNMSIYGAYSQHKIYKYFELRQIVKYALYRGVRIIFEIDAPAHAGYGWQWGPEAGLGNLTVCLNEQPWRSYCVQPPCGQLNPVNKNVYTVLQKIYSDIGNLIPWSEVFHMGGDELFIPCWNSSEEILNYLKDLPKTVDTFLDLWSDFQEKALEAYDRAIGHKKTRVILWTSHLTNVSVIQKYLTRDRYVIQTWVENEDPLPDQLLQMGYSLIVSTKNAWYLDHGFWGSTTYYGWRTVYSNQIPSDPGVLGGEVCMWGEYVDSNMIEGRVWPRAAAAAERLWTNPVTQFSDVEPRFYGHRERLVRRGIKADAVIPKWCYQNEGDCR